MTERHGNHIAGEWVAGVGEIENRNSPDVSGPIGHYAKEFHTTVKTAYIAAGNPERAQ